MDTRSKATDSTTKLKPMSFSTLNSRCASTSSFASSTASSAASSRTSSSIIRESSPNLSATSRTPILPPSVAKGRSEYDLPCEFAISGCHMRYHPSNFEDWVDHSLSHFHGCGPPPKSVCTYCDAAEGAFESAKDPYSGWQRRLEHIARHFANGQSSSTWRPDFFVIEHMRQNDLLLSDDYAWMMRHVEKPTLEGILHNKREVRYSTHRRDDIILREIHDLDKERRVMMKLRSVRKRHRAPSQMKVVLLQKPFTNSGINILDLTGSSERQTDKLLASPTLPSPGMNQVLEDVFTSSSTVPRPSGTSDTTYLTEESGSSERCEDIVYPILFALQNYWTSSQSALAMTSMTAKDVGLIKQLWRHLDFGSTSQKENIRHCGSSSVSGSTSISSSSSFGRRILNPRSTKRPRKGDDDHASGDEGSGEIQLKATSLTSSNKKDLALCFACPYRKYNPQEYSISDWESCALTPFENTSRIKTHLYQKHRVHQCKRCKIVFHEEEDLEAHDMANDRCVVVTAEPIQGVTKAIYDQLKSRKKSLWWNQGQAEADKWFNIFKLLLPNADLPLTPYFEPIEDSQEAIILLRIQEHMGQEVPRFFQAALETMRASDQINETTIDYIMGLLREAQNRAFATYRATVDQPIAQVGPEAQPPHLGSPATAILTSSYSIPGFSQDLPQVSEQREPILNFTGLQIGSQSNLPSSSVADSGNASHIPGSSPSSSVIDHRLQSMLSSPSPNLEDSLDFSASSSQTTPEWTELSHVYQAQAPWHIQSLGGTETLLSFSGNQILNDCSDPLCNWAVQICSVHEHN